MASKKTFKNPATNFISTAEPEVQTGSETQTTFIVPEGYKLVPENVKVVQEAKTIRAQILIRPSTRDALKKFAKENGTSMNDVINNAIEEYLERQG